MSKPCPIEISTAYQYKKGENIPWIISEYRTPKTEINAQEQIKKKKALTHKPPQRYITKRGYYMDYDLKVAKSLPSTHVHGSQKQWDFSSAKKTAYHRKMDPKLIKETYSDKIEINQKKRKIPGVCTYSLQKSLKEKEAINSKQKNKLVKSSQKIYYYQNTEVLSSQVPGVGNYLLNREISPVQKKNKTDYKFWIKKHKTQLAAQTKILRNLPGPANLTPMNSTFVTFDQLAIEYQKPSKKQCFGTDSKFQYTRPNKKTFIQKRPDPTVHGKLIQWKGKGISPKKSSWENLIWKGHSQSVYH